MFYELARGLITDIGSRAAFLSLRHTKGQDELKNYEICGNSVSQMGVEERYRGKGKRDALISK